VKQATLGIPQEHNDREALKHSSSKKIKITMRNEGRRDYHAGLIKGLGLHILTLLCVGARHDSEVLTFNRQDFYCFGIDVMSSTDYIKQVDAHLLKLHYKENSFDFAYAHHSLEHMYNAPLVLENIRFVSKHGILMTLPTESNPTKGHPTNFDVMSNPPSTQEEFLNNDFLRKDFEVFAPYEVKHFAKRKREVEILFVWEESHAVV